MSLQVLNMLFILFLGGDTPGSTHCLLLALFSEITPSGAGDTIWDKEDQTWLAICKANAILALLSLQPQQCYFILFYFLKLF